MLIQKFKETLLKNLGDCYVATRVWSAWGAGTMTEDDFTPLWDNEDFHHDLATALMGEVDKRSPVEFFAIGSTVKLKVSLIFATVTAVMIRGTNKVYEVVWWDGTTRKEAWVAEHELEDEYHICPTKRTLGLRI